MPDMPVMPDDASTMDISDGVTGTIQSKPPPAALARGNVVGRYLIIEVLGQGGMGTVYAAYDAELDRRIAIKVLHGRTGATRQQRMKREARALARLSHPNVIHVYDVGEVLGTGGLFLAMELVDGGSLDVWQAGAERSWRDIVTVYRDAGRGLLAAHRAGLIHRDFKPHNVLIGRDGQVRVTDFGLAKLALADEASMETTASGDSRTVDPDRSPDMHGAESDATRTATGAETGSDTGAETGSDTGAETGPGTEARASTSTGPGTGSNPLSEQLTEHGAILGTPAYMAPEQHRGQAASAASDQFSFCVALYEALYGKRPFGGSSIAELAWEVLNSQPAPAPADSDVPAAVYRVLARGLRREASERYSSMAELLTALEAAALRPKQRRLATLAGLAVMGVIVTAVLLIRAGEQRQVVCTTAPELAAQVWNEQAAAALQQAFVATGQVFAEDAWRVTKHGIDAYTTAWIATHRDACEATHVHGIQSPELLDARMACLSKRRDEIGALVTALMSGGAAVVAAAPDAVSALGDLSACSDLDSLRKRASLRAQVPARTNDPALRSRMEDLSRRIAAIWALRATGRTGEAIAAAKSITEDARLLGDEPLIADALLTQGQVELDSDDAAGAHETLTQALAMATRAYADDVAAEAAVELIEAARVRADYEEAGRWAMLAQAAAERTGDEGGIAVALRRTRSDLLVDQGQLKDAKAVVIEAVSKAERAFPPEHPTVLDALTHLGTIEMELGDYQQAEIRFRRAYELERRRLGEHHPRVATVLHNLGSIAYHRGEYDKARDFFTQSVAIRRQALGDMHSSVGETELSLAMTLEALGPPEEALAAYERALTIAESVHGKEHPEVAYVLSAMGSVYNARGEHERALAVNERALAIRKSHFAPDHRDIGESLMHIGIELKNLGRYRESVASYDQAREIFLKAYGPEHFSLAVVSVNQGEALRRMGDLAAALAAYERGLAIWESALGKEHPGLIHPLTGMGEVHLAQGKAALAIAVLERGIAVQAPKGRNDGDGGDKPVLAQAQFALARALVLAGAPADRAQALALAEEARAIYASLARERDLADVDAWLRQLKP